MRFARRPVAVALAAALQLTVGFVTETPAADMELWAPPGGNVVIKDSTGALLRMLERSGRGDLEQRRAPDDPERDVAQIVVDYAEEGEEWERAVTGEAQLWREAAMN